MNTDTSSSRHERPRPDCRRVLIADDNADAADSLAVLLQLEGYEVTVAVDGEIAWQLFQSDRPDIALLDIDMPELGGHELARRMRAAEGDSPVLLIAITGWGQEKDRRESDEAGFDYHLTKPVEPEDLIRLLRN
jgi:CheY-like chemotaxis protein